MGVLTAVGAAVSSNVGTLVGVLTAAGTGWPQAVRPKKKPKIKNNEIVCLGIDRNFGKNLRLFLEWVFIERSTDEHEQFSKLFYELRNQFVHLWML